MNIIIQYPTATILGSNDPRVMVKVNGYNAQMLLDTGAHVSVVPKKFIGVLQPTLSPQPSRAFGGSYITLNVVTRRCRSGSTFKLDGFGRTTEGSADAAMAGELGPPASRGGGWSPSEQPTMAPASNMPRGYRDDGSRFKPSLVDSFRRHASYASCK